MESYSTLDVGIHEATSSCFAKLDTKLLLGNASLFCLKAFYVFNAFQIKMTVERKVSIII